MVCSRRQAGERSRAGRSGGSGRGWSSVCLQILSQILPHLPPGRPTPISSQLGQVAGAAGLGPATQLLPAAGAAGPEKRGEPPRCSRLTGAFQRSVGLPSTGLPSPGSPKALRQVQTDEGDGDGDPDDEDALDEAGEGESCGGASTGTRHGTSFKGCSRGPVPAARSTRTYADHHGSPSMSAPS